MTLFKSHVQVSAFLADTVTQTLSPLADCSVNEYNDTLIKTAPFINLSLFQMVDVKNLATIAYTRSSIMPQIAINRIEIRAVWWPVLWPDEVRYIG